MRKEIIENLKVEDLKNLLSKEMKEKVLNYFNSFENALDTYQEGARLDDEENYLNAEEYFDLFLERMEVSEDE